jgi:dTDP-4-amino-4,6-dideoxygalactose transaminase
MRLIAVERAWLNGSSTLYFLYLIHAPESIQIRARWGNFQIRLRSAIRQESFMSAAMPLPALLGGPAVRPAGPPLWPLADEAILAALVASYQDGSWGKYDGGNVARLEAALCVAFQSGFAMTCASGTVAVEMALRSLGIGPGDEVILAAYDYPGNFLSVHAVGAQPVLVDVHGGVVPMRRVMEIAAAHGLSVIEDAAQCPGAVIGGRKAGTWGDVGVLSFGGSKLLSAGRGGAVLTSRADLYQRLRVIQSRGNRVCPLSELQAVVLLPQLARLDQRNAQRLTQVQKLAGLIAEIRGLQTFQNSAVDCMPGYYKLGFQLNSEQFGLGRDAFLKAVQAEGIAFDEGFRALHLGRSPKRYRRGERELTQAERAHHNAVLLHHPILLGNHQDMEEIHVALAKVQAHAGALRALFPS